MNAIARQLFRFLSLLPSIPLFLTNFVVPYYSQDCASVHHNMHAGAPHSRGLSWHPSSFKTYIRPCCPYILIYTHVQSIAKVKPSIWTIAEYVPNFLLHARKGKRTPGDENRDHDHRYKSDPISRLVTEAVTRVWESPDSGPWAI